MTERQWLRLVTPIEMLRFLAGQASDRKLRLYQVACCRRVWKLIPKKVCRDAVLVAEQYADGEVSDKELRATQAPVSGFRPNGDESKKVSGLAARQAGYATFYSVAKSVAKHLDFLDVSVALASAARKAAKPGERDPWTNVQHAEGRISAHLVRCIFGNPFRPAVVEDEWKTDTVLSLAKQMYASRDFDAMSVLADALQDAGCDNDDILNHCRGPGPHVRGCWVVDLVLGKT